MKRILIVDNTIDRPWGLCSDFRRYLEGEIVVRRAPEGDLPSKLDGFTHVILSGSKTEIVQSPPWEKPLMDLIREAVAKSIPTLGVCYGHQMIAKTYGGKSAVRKSPTPEFGWVKIEQTRPNPILEGLPKGFHSFQAHFEEVQKAPEGMVVTASSERCPIQAYYFEGKPLFGVQFHPERNAEEGQKSLVERKKTVSGDCIFGAGQAKSVFNENVARILFRNFIHYE